MNNTFIARKDDGSKVDFYEGRATFGNLNSELVARHCLCTEDTQNITEIDNWDEAEDASYVIEK